MRPSEVILGNTAIQAQTVISRGNPDHALRAVDMLFLFGFSLRLLLSNFVMNSITSYTSPGGSIFEKFHPGSYLILLAFILAKPLQLRIRLGRPLTEASLYFLLILASSLVFIVLRSGMSSVAYLIETFVVAVLAGLYLANAPVRLSSICLKLIIFVVALNSILALFEYATQTYFLPTDDYDFYQFRSFAIFGHPLLNALLTGTVALLVLRERLLGGWSGLFFVLALLAILAFGARAALVMLTLLTVSSLVWTHCRELLIGRARMLQIFATSAALLVGAGGLAYALLATPLGERFVALSSFDDGSSLTRLYAFSIYESLTPSQFWFGISPSLKALLIELNPFFHVIENFWIEMSLNLGMFFFSIFAVAFFTYFMRLGILTGLSTKATAAYFLIVASTNNSMSVKSPALLIFVVLLVSLRIVRAYNVLGSRRRGAENLLIEGERFS